MSSLSSPLQAVVELFSGPLHGVRFADIDGEGLGALAAEVDTLNGEVEAYEAQLTSLREALAQKQETLLALAQQALAYARIYAESDEVLSAELNEITLPRATKPRKGAPGKSASKAAKDDAESGVAPGAHVEVSEAEPPAPSKSKRKASVVEAPKAPVAEPEPEEEEEVAAPPKGARRKLPARSGRGR